MNVYFGGQLDQERRGNLAAVVTREGHDPVKYCVFVYPIDSQEFIHLTGVRSVRNPPERVYIGINNKTGGELAAKSDELNKGQATIRDLDTIVVTPYFLAQDHIKELNVR